MSAQRRRVVELPGVEHRAPIPAGVVIDNLLFSSALFGGSPETGDVPEDPAAQVGQLFANLVTLLHRAGFGPDDLARVGVLIRDNSIRPLINDEWLRLFPKPDDRPARHITVVPNLPVLAQLEIVAVGQSRPRDQV